MELVEKLNPKAAGNTRSQSVVSVLRMRICWIGSKVWVSIHSIMSASLEQGKGCIPLTIIFNWYNHYNLGQNWHSSSTVDTAWGFSGSASLRLVYGIGNRFNINRHGHHSFLGYFYREMYAKHYLHIRQQLKGQLPRWRQSLWSEGKMMCCPFFKP